MKPFAVVILNWNAAADTIECVESVLAGDAAAVPVVIDNGSEDTSVSELRQWSQSRGVRMAEIGPDGFDGLAAAVREAQVFLVRGTENLGFAKGCNLGLQAVRAFEVEESIFLNNDTVVAPGALSLLVQRLRDDPTVFATIPQIRIHRTGRIWNCGGKVSRLGYRKYFFAGAPVETTVLPAEIECSFFTGCCFAVRTEDFIARGGFSERFFFGEEDFELSLWMLDHHRRAVVLTQSIIDHKVSVAFTRASRRESAKIYVYYLNRFIHMRLRLGQMGWLAWLMVYLPYTIQLLSRTSALTVRELPRFVWKLLGDAMRHDGVDRALFMSIMRSEPW